MKNLLLIPAYKPDNKLIQLIYSLNDIKDLLILIINNGNLEKYDEIFEILNKFKNISILKVPINKGKGFGIKAGLNYILDSGNYGECNIIFADADGQHTCDDIIKMHKECLANKAKKIFFIGKRMFNKKTPKKNYTGNLIYNFLLSFFKNINLSDSLCGLRAISKKDSSMLINIKNNDFSFEIISLIKLKENNFFFKEVEVSSTYFSDHSSHFLNIADSYKLIKILFTKIY